MKNNKGFGLVEIMIILAIIFLIADLSMPTINKYIKDYNDKVELDKKIYVSTSNIDKYIKQVNIGLINSTKIDGNYYLNEMIDITSSETLSLDTSWIVIKNNVVKGGMFEDYSNDKAFFISYEDEKYTYLDVTKLPLKP